MNEFALLYRSKQSVEVEFNRRWDVFLSAFTNAERVRRVYRRVDAGRKLWLLHKEYGYRDEEAPAEEWIRLDGEDEAEDVRTALGALSPAELRSSICVDITGMMRPHVIMLPLLLQAAGILRFDVLYSEPGQYQLKEATTFSTGGVRIVRPVRGFEGTHGDETADDLLVIGSGYDYQLIAHAAEHKRSARKLQLFGFPSLRPDMYQENTLQAYQVREALGEQADLPERDFFASASDAFAVAEALDEIISRERARRPISNLYLSPLATKPQALGFAIYWMLRWRELAASIVFPFSSSYNRETSSGCSRVWCFSVELPAANL